MDIVNMTGEITKIKHWLKQNNVDSIHFDVIYDDVIKVNLVKWINGKPWTIQHIFDTFNIDLNRISDDYLEALAKELNERIDKEASK